MQRAANRAERLRQIEALLLESRAPITQAEIARQLHVHRSTILRDLASIPNVYQTADGRVAIDRRAYLVDVRFSLNEALALHLAARLLVTRMDRRNPHAASAVRRLGMAIRGLAPTISSALVASAAAMSADDQWSDPAYVAALEGLTEAWAGGHKVRVWHRSERSERSERGESGEAAGLREYVFAPYFIEPYAIGQATHVIGLREPPGALRTFRIERIARVEPLAETYAIPEDFDPQALLEDAWGIWFTGEPAVEVALRFCARVVPRVRESRWHRSQQFEPQLDGSLIWRAQIAEPREMLPWVLGWGGAVEVLAPAWLREEVAREAHQMEAQYGF